MTTLTDAMQNTRPRVSVKMARPVLEMCHTKPQPLDLNQIPAIVKAYGLTCHINYINLQNQCAQQDKTSSKYRVILCGYCVLGCITIQAFLEYLLCVSEHTVSQITPLKQRM